MAIGSWREASFTVERESVERWSDALLAAGALSVQAEDADADTTDEQALFGEPGMPAPDAPGWRRTRLAALMPATEDAAELLARAAAGIDAPAPLDFASRVFDDQDWVRLSQSQFEVIDIGRRLRITPSWRIAPQESAGDDHAQAGATHAPVVRIPAASSPDRATGRSAIVLDPGLAFGTGSHPTTRLCLGWLDAHLRTGETVIDYGCGSGILAIAAARLGASRVVGVDIDPQALVAARSNASINHAELTVLDAAGAELEPADVVLANILAAPLRLLAPLLQSLVAPGGALILAGLLARQIEEVSACYERIALAVYAIEDGWACLAGRKG